MHDKSQFGATMDVCLSDSDGCNRCDKGSWYDLTAAGLEENYVLVEDVARILVNSILAG